MTRGGARQKGAHFYARARFKGGRLEVRVPWATNLADTAARATIIGEVADELVEHGRPDLVRAVAKELAIAVSPKELLLARKAAKAIVDGAIKAGASRSITLKQWGERYTSGELARLFPDHVRAKDGSDDAGRLKRYVYPHVGNIPVVSFVLDHADGVMSKLPSALGSASRRHVAQCMVRLMHLAVFPGKLIPISPIPRGWLPKIRSRRHYTCLFPAEEARFLACGDVPEVLRLFVGVLNREGMRISELWDCDRTQWNLDLGDGGAFTATRTKTGDPRMWAARPDTARAMRTWMDRCSDRKPFAELDEVVGDRTALARTLRAALQKAGITRTELFASTEFTAQLRAHDLRATFVTVSLAEGRSETWIRDRTAHRSTSMIDRYKRAARQLAELRLGSLVDLVEALGWGTGGGNTPSPEEAHVACN